VPLLLVGGLESADTLVRVVPPPPGAEQVLVGRGGAPIRAELAAGPFPAVENARYALRVVVNTERADARIELELRDGAGLRLGRCLFPPGGYRPERRRQSVLLTCPLQRPERLRSAVLRLEGAERGVAVVGRRAGSGRIEAGSLVVAAPTGALDRLEPARPRLFRGPALLGALAASLLALALAAWASRRLA